MRDVMVHKDALGRLWPEPPPRTSTVEVPVVEGITVAEIEELQAGWEQGFADGKGERDALRRERDEARAACVEARAQLVEADMAIEVLRQEVACVERRRDDARAQVERLVQRAAENHDALLAEGIMPTSEQTEVAAMRRALLATERERDDAQAQARERDEALAEAARDRDEARAKVEKLEGELIAVRARCGSAPAADAVDPLRDAADAEYRACWLDQGDRLPDVSAWTTDRDEAMETARRVAAVADPQYDEVWLERRVCSPAERVVFLLGASDG